MLGPKQPSAVAWQLHPRLTVPWLRIVWQLWFVRLLADDEGRYYLKWSHRPGLFRVHGRRILPSQRFTRSSRESRGTPT